jgi:hypothetical protein
MATTPFQQQFTWRKLGYLVFSDSLAYRDVLDENPQWNVVTLPPIGAQIALNSGAQSSNGQLLQSAFVFGLPSGDVSDEISPYSSEKEYFSALNRYNVAGVTNRSRINGYSFDDYSARTGLQG